MKKTVIILSVLGILAGISVLIFYLLGFRLSESGWLITRKPPINDYYAGFVVDELGRPVEGVLIKENTATEPLETRTDENGFFKLTRIEGIICNLKIEKDGYKSEIVSTSRYHAKNQEDGWREYYSFLTSDTTTIVLHSDFKQPENEELFNETAVDTTNWTQFKSKYNFATFSTEIFTGKLASPDFTGNEFAKDSLYVDFITGGCNEEGINFGGHYTIIERSCGCMCQHIFIVDRISGKVFTHTKPNDGRYGFLYKPDSKLLIANSEVLSTDLTQYCTVWGIVPELYVWKNKNFKRIQ